LKHIFIIESDVKLSRLIIIAVCSREQRQHNPASIAPEDPSRMRHRQSRICWLFALCSLVESTLGSTELYNYRSFVAQEMVISCPCSACRRAGARSPPRHGRPARPVHSARSRAMSVNVPPMSTAMRMSDWPATEELPAVLSYIGRGARGASATPRRSDPSARCPGGALTAARQVRS
jgi:hypothetical protein